MIAIDRQTAVAEIMQRLSPANRVAAIKAAGFASGESASYQRYLDIAYDGSETAYREAARVASVPDDTLRRYIQAGYVALPHQLKFAAFSRMADAGDIDKIGIGGRRGPGKTHTVFAHTAIDDCQKYSNLKFLFLRKVGKAATESFGDLRGKVLGSVPHVYKSSRGIIEFPNGSRIITGNFRTESDIDKYLGIEYDGMIIEEANTISRSKKQALRGSLRTSKDNWHPREYDTFNPGGVGHGDIKKTFIVPHKKGEETTSRFIDCGVDDNPFVNKSYRRFLEGLTGWLRKAWLDGDWDILAGQFFVTWNEKEHVQTFDTPRGAIYWLAMDYGFVHWNVCHLFAYHAGVVYVIDEYASRLTSVDEDIAAIEAMLRRNDIWRSDVRQFVAGADVFARRKRGEGEGRTIADDYADRGFNLVAANSDRVNGAAEILRLLGDTRNGKPSKIVIHSRCHRLKETLPLMEHDPKRGEDVLKTNSDENGGGGDDAYDCFRYGVMAAPVLGHGWGSNPLQNYRG